MTDAGIKALKARKKSFEVSATLHRSAVTGRCLDNAACSYQNQGGRARNHRFAGIGRSLKDAACSSGNQAEELAKLTRKSLHGFRTFVYLMNKQLSESPWSRSGSHKERFWIETASHFFTYSHVIRRRHGVRAGGKIHSLTPEPSKPAGLRVRH